MVVHIDLPVLLSIFWRHFTGRGGNPKSEIDGLTTEKKKLRILVEFFALYMSHGGTWKDFLNDDNPHHSKGSACEFYRVIRRKQGSQENAGLIHYNIRQGVACSCCASRVVWCLNWLHLPNMLHESLWMWLKWGAWTHWKSVASKLRILAKGVNYMGVRLICKDIY